MARFEFPKFLYARTKDNKTIDVSYAPQTPDAVEYIRNYIVQQEQLEVDFEKDAVQFCFDKGLNVTPYQAKTIARHYYELGSMNKIALIRAEVERYIKHYEKLERNDFQNGELYICQELLFLINSTQQEQQEVDLDKEIETEWKKCNPVDEGMGVESAYMHIEAFDMIARHFYELGKNSK